MSFLRLLSSRAFQNVTFHCVNSVVWQNARTRSSSDAVRLRGENDHEWSATDRVGRPHVLVDKCQVLHVKCRQVGEILEERGTEAVVGQK